MNSPELAATVRLTMQADLLRWLGDLIEVSAVDAVSEENVLRITVSYRIRRTGVQGTVVAERPIPGEGSA